MKQRLVFHKGTVRPEGKKKMRVSNAICILFGTSINYFITQDTTWKLYYLGLFGILERKGSLTGLFFQEGALKDDLY